MENNKNSFFIGCANAIPFVILSWAIIFGVGYWIVYLASHSGL